MNAKEFVACWKREKEQLLEAFVDASRETLGSQKIASLGIRADPMPVIREIIDGVLTDTFYTLLLGLDGAASLGGIQQEYEIHDESGNRIFEPGELESEAYEQFHGGS